ncbi:MULTISPECIES: transporter substrate-binding domain-containing protein [unclassified Spirillospora]|uniref:transporter substrate-binding domain-containing protein n=1 Tax=unclassified Spirillospora TaxID=2642701 RepID=UPI003722AAB0
MTRISGRPLSALVMTAVASLVVTLSGCGSEAEPDTEKLPAGAVPALHQKLPDSMKKSGVIRFAGDPHPPYRIVGADGKITTGLDLDVQAALGRVLGVRTEIVAVSGLAASLGGMLAGRHDIFNGPVQDTAEREKQFDAVVWMTTGTSYLIPAGSGQAVKGAADLCGKRVAIVAGSVVENHMKGLDDHCRKLGKGALTPVGLADTNSTLLAVKAGRADAAGMTQNAALYAMRQEKNTYGIVTQTEEQGAGTAQLALLAAKRDKLGPVVLDAFRELFRTGEYQKIMKKWGMEQVMVPEPKMNVASGA